MVRQPRALVDRFSMHREHREKEWWRERRLAPATFMGFPDVSKAALRGGSLYVEKMDSVTLAVILDKCVKEDWLDDEMWGKFCWHSQKLAVKMIEPDLCYTFRAFAKANKFQSNWFATYVGRILILDLVFGFGGDLSRTLWNALETNLKSLGGMIGNCLAPPNEEYVFYPRTHTTSFLHIKPNFLSKTQKLDHQYSS